MAAKIAACLGERGDRPGWRVQRLQGIAQIAPEHLAQRSHDHGEGPVATRLDQPEMEPYVSRVEGSDVDPWLTHHLQSRPGLAQDARVGAGDRRAFEQQTQLDQVRQRHPAEPQRVLESLRGAGVGQPRADPWPRRGDRVPPAQQTR